MNGVLPRAKTREGIRSCSSGLAGSIPVTVPKRTRIHHNRDWPSAWYQPSLEQPRSIVGHPRASHAKSIKVHPMGTYQPRIHTSGMQCKTKHVSLRCPLPDAPLWRCFIPMPPTGALPMLRISRMVTTGSTRIGKTATLTISRAISGNLSPARTHYKFTMTAALRIAFDLALQLASDAYPDSIVEVLETAPCSGILPQDWTDPANDSVCVVIRERCAHGDPTMPCYYMDPLYHVVEIDLSGRPYHRGLAGKQAARAIVGYDLTWDNDNQPVFSMAWDTL